MFFGLKKQSQALLPSLRSARRASIINSLAFANNANNGGDGLGFVLPFLVKFKYNYII